jgi:hypothetical protein
MWRRVAVVATGCAQLVGAAVVVVVVGGSVVVGASVVVGGGCVSVGAVAGGCVSVGAVAGGCAGGVGDTVGAREVVVVVGGTLVVVVSVGGTVVVVVAFGGTVVVVVGGVVVVVDDAPETALMRAVMVEGEGFGTWAPAGRKPTVISWALASLSSVGLPLATVPVVDVKFGQDSTTTNPGLPASGVPLAQVCPLVSSVFPGYCTVMEVRVSPGYSDTNFPSVAFPPDSELFTGEMVTTPVPFAVRPVVVLAFAGRLGSIVPHTSMARAACHVSDVVGDPAEDNSG